MTGENSPLRQMGHYNAPDTGAGAFRLISCPSLSHEQRQDNYFEAGRSIKDCLASLGWNTSGNLQARVTINGELVSDAEWLSVKPPKDASVVIRRTYGMMGGGKGANTGKQIMGIIAMLTVAIGAIYAPALLPSIASMASAMGASGGVWGGIMGAGGFISAAVGIGGCIGLHVAKTSRPRPVLLPMETR